MTSRQQNQIYKMFFNFVIKVPKVLTVSVLKNLVLKCFCPQKFGPQLEKVLNRFCPQNFGHEKGKVLTIFVLKFREDKKSRKFSK